MKKLLLVAALLTLACKPTCDQLTQALALAKASGDATLIAQAQKAYDEAKCTVTLPPPVTPPPVEPPPVTPPPVTPPPAPACLIEGDLVVNEVQSPAQLQARVREAITSIPNPVGIAPAVTLERVAAKLREFGLCAIAGTEAVFVLRADGKLVEEYHPVFFGDGGWTDSGNGKYIGVHRRKSEAPTPPPPLVDACPAEPCPPRVYADTGKPHWHWNAKQHTMGNGDSTEVVDKACAFCASIGLGDMGGAIRCSCPVRPDGHPERVAIEAWLTEGGAVRDGRNGQDCTPNHTDNPNAFLWGTGNCRMCNTPKTVCSDWY